ncbi:MULTISPECIES: curli assembly protein CsgF [Alcaligenes]|uniref:Curli production assembly/transport component CsgF n=2 Tax=Alcaligenes TaxID=507 RepID=A0AB33CSN7_ALCFA|nr:MULTISPECIES: curli assembly protein CsgF [Alcaligenes]ASR89536.1 curli assembly protein CsgF [Alcaligenes faecalis]AWG34417.1 curli assembly protein CsgF [Alcaligenes aquatilis]MCC9162748.1 curli assembly protein CsgF [Alcaligenes sp. MMA]QXR37642.1 curli assembly protein CsgF [Alcaligenes aquatilis]UQN37647.1 curli assembly protein CsgF [Alcaligenes aquatilis]
MKTFLPLASVLLTGALFAPVHATELIYTPVNPNFGGSPLNGQWLLNSAQVTNKHTDPEAEDLGSSFEQRTPFQDFNDQLERSVLSRLASAASSQFVDSNGKFVPGTFETGSFTVSVVDIGGGALTITTTDRITGASTTFRVMQP